MTDGPMPDVPMTPIDESDTVNDKSMADRIATIEMMQSQMASQVDWLCQQLYMAMQAFQKFPGFSQMMGRNSNG